MTWQRKGATCAIAGIAIAGCAISGTSDCPHAAWNESIETTSWSETTTGTDEWNTVNNSADTGDCY